MTEDQRAQLQQAAQDPQLDHWRRDLMRDLAAPGTPATREADGAWALVVPPLYRASHTAIHDPVRDRLIVFGGDNDTLRSDIWVLSLGGSPAWSQLRPSGTPPSARAGHTAIYDPTRDRMVIFGGNDGSYCGDVWALSLGGFPAWSELSPSGTPPSARAWHTAIYDPVRDCMVVFGGSDGSSRNDTWALSFAGVPTWSELTPSGTPPSARSQHTAIYDPVRDRMVVFGGHYLRDTWVLSLAGTPVWSELDPSGVLPDWSWGHTAIYDPMRDRMVVFGSVGDEAVPWRNDTWALSLAGDPAWSELAPSGSAPCARGHHAAIYDPVRDRMLVFGGYDDLRHRNLRDTWSLDLTDPPAWSELAPSGVTPCGRSEHAAIYDPVRDRMVVFGGYYDDYVQNDTWALPLAGAPTWSELTPSGTPPRGRLGHTAIYDSGGDRMIVFGGFEMHYPTHNTTWALSLGDTPIWSEIPIAVGTLPSRRWGHTAIYDPVRERMVVFGGTPDPGSGYANDTWALSLVGMPRWSQLTPAGTPPPARRDHTAIYDPVRDRMVVFGGYDGSRRNDIWVLSLAGTPAWSELTPSGTPPSARDGHTAVYDPARDRMVVFGGNDGSSRGDAWALSLAGTPVWSELAPSETPPPVRYDHTAIYDPARDRMLVFGGGDHPPLGDTWALAWSVTGVPQPGTQMPSHLLLHRARPNPASGSTLLRFDLPVAQPVRLAVYDVTGRLVRRLVDAPLPAGARQAEWDGRDDGGRAVPPGLYYARLEAGGRSLTEKVVILR